MWANFHTHSNYCDGRQTLDEYVLHAKSNNLISLGFSSHAPVSFPCSWCMKKEKLNDYLASIDKLKASNPALEIYKSLEIDYVPSVISPADFTDRLDYTIGSIHFIEHFNDGKPWEIDGAPEIFREGYEKIFRRNIKDVICRYYELTREMVEISKPTIIGHLDKIKIQNRNNQFFDETEQWYKEEIVKTLNVIKECGGIIEVNTRGIYQKKTIDPYPARWILEKICERRIPITLNSDAHHPEELVHSFTDTATLLYSIGFKHLSILHEGSWRSYSFNEHGLIIT